MCLDADTSHPARLAERIAEWIASTVREAAAQGVVVGLSGGIDSAVAAALAHRALPGQVLCAILPCESTPDDAAEAHLFCQNLGIESIDLDLSAPYRELVGLLPPATPLVLANIKPRLRMIALYHLAAQRSYLVCGTSNRTELLIGYSTKHGDGAADLLPLGGVLKRHVYALAAELDVPDSIIQRPPSAGLWPGQTDEGELGITYQALDHAIEAIDRGELDAVPPEVLTRVKTLMERSAHKRALPPTFQPDLA